MPNNNTNIMKAICEYIKVAEPTMFKQASSLKALNTKYHKVNNALQKEASKQAVFMNSLEDKLNTAKMEGRLTQEKVAHILKEARINPINILNYLEVPSVDLNFAKVASTSQSRRGKNDPLYEFVYGNKE